MSNNKSTIVVLLLLATLRAASAIEFVDGDPNGSVACSVLGTLAVDENDVGDQSITWVCVQTGTILTAKWSKIDPDGAVLYADAFPSLQAAIDSVSAGGGLGTLEGEATIMLSCRDYTLASGIVIGNPTLPGGQGLKSGLTLRGCGAGVKDNCATTLIYDGPDSGTALRVTGRNISLEDFCLDGDGPGSGGAATGIEWIHNNTTGFSATGRSNYAEKIHVWDVTGANYKITYAAAAGATDGMMDRSLFSMLEATGGEKCVDYVSNAAKVNTFISLGCYEQTGDAVHMRDGGALFVSPMITATGAAGLDRAFRVEEPVDQLSIIDGSTEICDGPSIERVDTDGDGTFEHGGTLRWEGGSLAMALGGAGVTCTAEDCPDGIIIRGAGTVSISNTYISTFTCGLGTPAKAEIRIDANNAISKLRLAQAELRAANQWSEANTFLTVSGVQNIVSPNGGAYAGNQRGLFSVWGAISDDNLYDTGNEVCARKQRECQSVYLPLADTSTTCSFDHAVDTVFLAFCR